MGRLAELFRAGVSLPKGFTVTVEAFRRHWDQAGLDEMADAALGGLGAEAGPAEIEAAAGAIRAELAGRDLGADLAALIADAYEELSSRCFEITSRPRCAARPSARTPARPVSPASST